MSDYRPTPVLRFVEREILDAERLPIKTVRILQQRWEQLGKPPELKTAEDYFTKGLEPIPPQYEWRDVSVCDETES